MRTLGWVVAAVAIAGAGYFAWKWRGFYPSSIALLNTQWVFAYFENGHAAGDCLLEYDVLPGGAITWKVIRSRLMN